MSRVNPNDCNPVDYYNFNYIQHTIEQLLKLKNVKQVGIDALSYVVNKDDETKRMIVIEDGFFVVKESNKWGMKVGEKYTAFMMLQKHVYKDNWSVTLSYVMYDIMDIPNDYIRVGIKYYRKIYKEDRYGVNRTELSVWDKPTIVDDHGKDYIHSIPKYKDFTIRPDNKNYEPIYKGNYNVYAPFDHIPMDALDYIGTDQWKWIFTLMNHIFGDQIELGFKYMKVLYDFPRQALPILVLISEERQTGKSTFLDLLNVIFGANTVIINPQDISNSFNSTYADKNVIMIEESHFDSKQATEKLKNLSTQKKISVNTKFVKQHSLPFYGKLIITSNDEDKFSKVDDPEIRYWVRKIPTLVGKANHNILEDMTKEIPAFLAYLNTLPEVDCSASRMVFTAEQLQTKELATVKKESRVELHKEIEMYLDNYCLQNLKVEKFYFVAMDIKNLFFLNNNQIKVSYVNKILRSAMKLEKLGPTRYTPIEKQDGTPSLETVLGRPYVYKNPYFGQKIGEDINDADASTDIPF